MSPLPTVVIVPPNDPEAVLISQIAKAMGLAVICSGQAHGASLDHGRDFVAAVKEGKWKRVIVVEMPGVKTERKLIKLGVELVIIDHHQYDALDRAHDKKTGKLLFSSLEQLIRLFRISDKKLRALGFDPKLVQGVAIFDRGFVWALQKARFTKKEIIRVIEYQKELMRSVKEMKNEGEKEKIVQSAWAKREIWGSFLIVQDDHGVGIRPGISLCVAIEIGKPTPIIVVEKKRGFIYVQESRFAERLLKQFGGFTFGEQNNWGYRNQKGKPKVGLRDVKKFLEKEN